MLTVTQVETIAAHMVRVTLSGDLEGFTSLGFDDHVKLFFPDGTKNAEGAPNMLGRDFTPRRYDPAQDTLEIDFAIHDAGPATRWAAQAKPGDTLALGGPRGSFIIPTTYDWHLLDRRRDRPARHQPPACRTSGPNPRRRRRRGRRPRTTRSHCRPPQTRP